MRFKSVADIFTVVAVFSAVILFYTSIAALVIWAFS